MAQRVIQFDEVAAANDLAARLVVEENWTIAKALEQTAVSTEAGVNVRIEHHQDRRKRHAKGEVSTATQVAQRHDTDIIPYVRVRQLRPS